MSNIDKGGKGKPSDVRLLGLHFSANTRPGPAQGPGRTELGPGPAQPGQRGYGEAFRRIFARASSGWAQPGPDRIGAGPGPAWTGPVRPGPIWGRAGPGRAQLGRSGAGPNALICTSFVSAGPAQPGPSRPGLAQPGPAQPSPAQASPGSARRAAGPARPELRCQ